MRKPALLLLLVFMCLATSAQDFSEFTFEGALQDLQMNDSTSAEEIAEVVLKLQAVDEKKADILLKLGIHLVSRYKYEDSDYILNKCLELSSDPNTRAEAYFQLGLSTMYRDIRIQSLNHFQKSLTAYTSLNDSLGMGRSLDKIADNHNYLGEHTTARPYYDRALEIFSNIQDTAALTNVLGNIGGMFNEDNLNDSSIYYYTQSTKLNKQSGNLSNLSDDLAGIAMAYEDLNKLEQAYQYYINCYNTAYLGGNDEDQAFANQHLGFYHYRVGNLDSAIYYMRITYDLAKQMNYSQLLINSLDVLHRSYYSIGQYRQAYDVFEEASMLNDSLLSLENISIINSLKSEYDLERQAATNESLLNEAAIREEYIQQQATLNLLLIIGALLLVTALVFLVMLNRARKKKNKIIVQDRDLIKEQTEKLKEMDQLKSTFFANVSHDFRAPITLLKGFADLIKINQPDLTEESKEYINQIHETAQRLTSMSEEINQLIQLENSQYQLKKESIDVNELFGTIGKMYQLGRKKNDLSFKYRSEIEHGTKLSADRSALEKIIFNLIENAYKYNTSGNEVSVALSIEGENIKMVVCDDGPGILPEKIDKVFDRYYRTEKGTEAATGLGIGLSLVKDLVELHDGKVFVTSTPNVQTCFTVLLPLGQLS
jgi:signal transduction histidine kinase